MSHLIRIFLVAFVLALALSACGGNNRAVEGEEPAAEVVEEAEEAVEDEGAQPEPEEAAQSMPMEMGDEDMHTVDGHNEGDEHAPMGMSAQADEHATNEHAESHEHDQGDEHSMDEHAASGGMAAMHGVPAEAAAVDNPVPSSAESIAVGAEIYAQSCAVCHGEAGEGDGPGGAALDPKPADLTVEHVQANSDGALFYIISHGVEGTGMPAWEEQLSEEQRWSVVNFVRTLD